MSNRYLHVLCEGQCEADFVKEQLSVFLQKYSIYTQYSIINTNKDLGKKGGIIPYSKFKKEVINLLENPHLVLTTLIDLYGLPNDFPGIDTCRCIDKYKYKYCIENKIQEDIENLGEMFKERFIPYIQLHEYEALFFSECTKKKLVDLQIIEKNVLQNIHENPELINSNNPPSFRLSEKYRKAKVEYNRKVLDTIEIEFIIQNFRGFKEWIEKIKNVFNH